MTQPLIGELERELAALLAKEQSALQALMATLEVEAEALKSREMDGLKETAQTKQRQLDAFNRQVQARLSYLSTHEIDASESGFESLLKSMHHSAQTALQTQWQALKDQFEQALILNERNGQLIQVSQMRNRQMLSILHGQRNKPNLYNNKGASQNSANQHRLGEA